MAKILIITNRLVVGGPSVHLLQLIGNLCQKHQFLLVYGVADKSEASMEKEFINLGIDLIKVDSLKRSINVLNDISFAKELRAIIENFEPDIVHTHTYKPGLAGRYMANKLKVKKIIHTYHGLIFKTYFNPVFSRILVLLDRYLTSKTDVLIALSPRQKLELIDVYKIAPASKVQVIPLASSFTKEDFGHAKAVHFKEYWNIEPETLVLAQVGRLVEVKELTFMIDMFNSIKSKIRNKSVLLIVGDGNLKESLIEQAYSLHFSVAVDIPKEGADIIFTSWCKDLTGMYSAMDLLVLTSKSEGTPLTIIEAQQASTAVLAPHIGGIKDMVQKEETAMLFSSAAEFEDKLLFLINNKSILFDMGLKAGTFASARFDLPTMIGMYDKMYK